MRPAPVPDMSAVDETGEDGRYVLRLFVAGTTPRSTRAIENLRRICEAELDGRHSLQVVDVYRDPAAARDDQVFAAPTLVRLLPLPVRRLVGDLSDRGRVLQALDLHPTSDAPEAGR